MAPGYVKRPIGIRKNPSITTSKKKVKTNSDAEQPGDTDARPAQLGAPHHPASEHRAQEDPVRVAGPVHEERLRHHRARLAPRDPSRHVQHPRTPVEEPGVVGAPGVEIVQHRVLEEQQAECPHQHAVGRDPPFPTPRPDDEVVEADGEPEHDDARPGDEDDLHEHRRIARPGRHPHEVRTGDPLAQT